MRIAICTLAAAALSAAGPAAAEKADKDKPTRLEAGRMSSDDARRMSIFEGNVVLTKGTITVRAERIVVRQDAEGFQHSTATGKPVRFRQKGDPQGECEGLWLDGEALRVEIDDRDEKVELFDSARVTRGEDEVRGDYIFVDQRSSFFSVSAAKGASAAAPQGRVRAVIQPRPAAEPRKPACRASKPAAAAQAPTPR